MNLKLNINTFFLFVSDVANFIDYNHCDLKRTFNVAAATLRNPTHALFL